jgi:hypothetical protein
MKGTPKSAKAHRRWVSYRHQAFAALLQPIIALAKLQKLTVTVNTAKIHNVQPDPEFANSFSTIVTEAVKLMRQIESTNQVAARFAQIFLDAIAVESLTWGA